jgi:hypothetical protein
MPLTDPTAFRDKTEDWLEVFRARRLAALRPLVTAELVAEHRARPKEPHGRDLQLVLNYVRGPAAPVAGKVFVHVRRPYVEYGLAVMTDRGTPPILLDDGPFATEREAHHAAFLRRLEAHGLDAGLRGADGV